MITGSRSVYVYNKTREAFVGTEIGVADTYFGRLVGLLGKTRGWCRFGRGLWIIPSQGVHTIGMLFPIDVVFLSKEKQVLDLEEYVRPFRMSKLHWDAASVLELSPHTIFQSGIQVGDHLEIVFASTSGNGAKENKTTASSREPAAKTKLVLAQSGKGSSSGRQGDSKRNPAITRKVVSEEHGP